MILVVILLLFGSTRLPKLARSLGQAQKEFKEGVRDSAREEPRSDPEEQITMSRAQLEELLARWEAEARKNEPPNS